MSDTRLRELYRLWEGTGSTGDEATFLSELIRHGVLCVDDVQEAALLGHEASQIVVESDESAADSLQTWLNWAHQRARSRALLTRVALVVAIDFFEDWLQPPLEHNDAWMSVMFSLAEWLRTKSAFWSSSLFDNLYKLRSAYPGVVIELHQRDGAAEPDSRSLAVTTLVNASMVCREVDSRAVERLEANLRLYERHRSLEQLAVKVRSHVAPILLGRSDLQQEKLKTYHRIHWVNPWKQPPADPD